MSLYGVVIILAAFCLAGYCIHDPSCQLMAKEVMFLCGTAIGGVLGNASTTQKGKADG